MPKYLIDVNLPYYFSLWKGADYIHQKDINDEWTDEQIWKYAQNNQLTIVTKDKDFSNRIILNTPPPRVIHVRFGNMKMKEFNEVVAKNWVQVCALSEQFKLVNFYKDKIEGIK